MILLCIRSDVMGKGPLVDKAETLLPRLCNQDTKESIVETMADSHTAEYFIKYDLTGIDIDDEEGFILNLSFSNTELYYRSLFRPVFTTVGKMMKDAQFLAEKKKHLRKFKSV